MTPENKILTEDLKFIREVLVELTINPEDYDFGPAYELAKSRKKLAKVKLDRIIREIRLKLI